MPDSVLVEGGSALNCKPTSVQAKAIIVGYKGGGKGKHFTVYRYHDWLIFTEWILRFNRKAACPDHAWC